MECRNTYRRYADCFVYPRHRHNRVEYLQNKKASPGRMPYNVGRLRRPWTH